MKLSVVIAVFSQQVGLDELDRRLETVLSKMRLEQGISDYEIIYVEDGSPDGSWQSVKSVCDKNQHARGVRLSRNFGQHSALCAGLMEVDGDYVVLMDCDLQDRPEMIPSLFRAIQEQDVDIVYARRVNRQDSELKKLTSKAFYRVISSCSGFEFEPEIGVFRITSRQVVSTFNNLPEVNKFVGGLFYWIGFTSGRIDVDHAERVHGVTNYNFNRSLKMAKHAIFSFSNHLLRLGFLFGFLSAAIAFSLGLYMIVAYLLYDVPMGYSSIVVSIYFIGGAILTVLGIIGEYIGEIFDQVKRRPSYIISERVGAYESR